MSDAVARYCAASESNDIDAAMLALAPDAALARRSPAGRCSEDMTTCACC